MLKLKRNIKTNPLHILISNKSLYKNNLYLYNKIVFIPVAIVDKPFWKNIYKKKPKKKKIKFF